MKKQIIQTKGIQRELAQVHDRGALLEKYEEFQDLYGNVVKSTSDSYKYYIEQFLDWIDFDNSPERLSQLDFQAIQEFTVAFAKTHNYRKGMHCSLRSFLRFCYIESHLGMDLSESVPSVQERKLASVPFIIDEDSLTKLFESIDRNDITGKRDTSILKMMLTYGVREIQVRQLKLEDLFWHQGRVLFRSVKGGLAVEQPLVPEVSNALQDYLLNARPESSDYREVFLTVVPPFRPLAEGSMSDMVTRRLIRAKIQRPPMPARVLTCFAIHLHQDF